MADEINTDSVQPPVNNTSNKLSFEINGSYDYNDPVTPIITFTKINLLKEGGETPLELTDTNDLENLFKPTPLNKLQELIESEDFKTKIQTVIGNAKIYSILGGKKTKKRYFRKNKKNNKKQTKKYK